MLLLAGVVAVFGCGGEPPGADPVTARDSSGIDIVVFDTAAAGRWSLAEPIWSIRELGREAQRHPLSDIVGLATLADGRLAIAEGSTGLIHVGDPDGDWVSIGGHGDGPDEVARLYGLAVTSGDVWVLDVGRRRVLSVGFTPTGSSSLESVDLPSAVGAVRGWAPSGESYLILSAETFSPTEAPGMFRGAAYLMRVSPTAVDTVAELRGIETFRGEAGSGTPLVPGMPYLVTAGDQVWTADSHQAEVTLRNERGAAIAIARWPVDPSTTVESQGNQVLDDLVSTLDVQQRAAVRSALASVPSGSSPVRFSDLRPTLRGGVWIGPLRAQTTFGLVDAPTRTAGPWIAIEADLSSARLVSVPVAFEPLVIDDGFVIGVFRDELGVEHVQRRNLVAVSEGR